MIDRISVPMKLTASLSFSAEMLIVLLDSNLLISCELVSVGLGHKLSDIYLSLVMTFE